MQYKKGDTATLYCEFICNDNPVLVENPQVRILHEQDDNVYEDLSWQPMTEFGTGYIYSFDTNICTKYGDYVVVFNGIYEGQTLNNIETITLVAENRLDTDTIDIYGYVNDIGNSRLVRNAKVEIIDTIINTPIYTSVTDDDGKWCAKITPGEYEFIFTKEGYESRTVRAQVGDENKEIQFSNISLENIRDTILGNGLYRIEDTFVRKNKQPIANVDIKIYTSNDTVTPYVTTTTDVKGKWHVFLDDGSYIMQITLPSGTEKKFRLIVRNDGSKDMEEIQSTSSAVTSRINNGTGDKEVNDYVLDAHGRPIEGAIIKAYTQQNDEYVCVASDTTSIDGNFILHLDQGTYKLTVECDTFETKEIELKL